MGPDNKMKMKIAQLICFMRLKNEESDNFFIFEKFKKWTVFLRDVIKHVHCFTFAIECYLRFFSILIEKLVYGEEEKILSDKRSGILSLAHKWNMSIPCLLKHYDTLPELLQKIFIPKYEYIIDLPK